MAARSRARYLAPIALAAVIAGTYLVIHDTLKTKKSNTASPPATQAQNKPGTHHKGHSATKFYVVKSGDNLTGIAAKTGVALTTIEALNHHVDPNSLQTGEKLRLRR